MVVHGQQPRPRALLEDLPEGVVDEISRLFGFARVVSSGDRVDESEYDVLVTVANVMRSGQLHVLALGSPRLGMVDIDAPPGSASSVDHSSTVEGQWPTPFAGSVFLVNQLGPASGFRRRPRPTRVAGSIILVKDVLARQLDIPRGATGSVRELVDETLVPVIAAITDTRPRWEAFARDAPESPLRQQARFSGPQVLLTSHRAEEVMAFVGRRYDRAGGVIVALPVIPESVSRWVLWFLDRVRDADPAAFPLEVAWQDDPEWAPPTVGTALGELASARRRRADLLAELEASEERARASLEAARTAAAPVWRLVTEQGDVLNAAVQEALVELGFEVIDSDNGRPDNEPKMEDLRVSDTADPGWVGLVEVKGFTKGASPRGATQLIGRPVQAYLRESGRVPDALWYVVNHLIQTGPRERPPALERDSIIDVLAEMDGVLIDSRDLLRAVIAVRSSAVDPTVVRASLRTARGRWAWPPG